MNDPASRTRYRVAQVWRFRNETPEARDELVILGVEDHPSRGILCQVHVGYEPTLWDAPNAWVDGCNFWVTDTALDRSVTGLVAERGDLPFWYGSTGEFRFGPESWARPHAPIGDERDVGELVREQTDAIKRESMERASRPPHREPPDEALGLWSLIALGKEARLRELLTNDPELADRPLPRDESDDYCYSGEEYDECYPLMLAAELGDNSVAELLLGAGADPRRANARGDTALHFAARSSTRDDGPAVVARLLCERGADPTTLNRAGQTPITITYASDLAAVLIEFGAPPTLNHALCLGMVEWARRALREDPEAVRGAPFPTMVVDNIGELIRREAERRHGREVRLARGEVPTEDEDEWPDLMAHKEAIASRFARDGTPVGEAERLKALLRFVDLQRASFQEFRDLLEAALSRGADPNDGTSLYYAVQMLDTSLAEWLLAHGADPNRDQKRGIASYLTEIAATVAMAALLRRHGAADNPYARVASP